jgi:branched-chain amino acid transport system permease protein
MTAIILQLVISGLLLGGIYALVSVGLTLIFGVSRIKNFAHGDLVMVGMYVTYALTVASGLDPYLLAPVVVLLLFGFGLFLSFALIRPIQGAPQVAQIFATVGLGLVLQNLALMMYGADFRSTPSIISGKVLRFAGVALPASLLIAFIVAMVVIAGLTIFLRLSLTGKAMRAIAQDRRAASLMSIDVKRIDMLTFGLGTACAGLAGALLAPVFPAFPTVGVNLVLICFVVVILGGLGSVEGALIGGLLIGLVETLSGFFLGSAMSQIAYFLVFIAVLCLRPAGLFGQRGAETLGS